MTNVNNSNLISSQEPSAYETEQTYDNSNIERGPIDVSTSRGSSSLTINQGVDSVRESLMQDPENFDGFDKVNTIKTAIDELSNRLIDPKVFMKSKKDLPSGVYINQDVLSEGAGIKQGQPFFLVMSEGEDLFIEKIVASLHELLQSKLIIESKGQLNKWLSGSIVQLLSSVFKLSPEEINDAIADGDKLKQLLETRHVALTSLYSGDALFDSVQDIDGSLPDHSGEECDDSISSLDDIAAFNA